MVKSAEFVKSSPDYRQSPKADKPEFAFIGRSNVGKSSLINALVNKKDLAKTSSQPGKTQLINHFLIDQDWYLVDLPGYGYARVSRDNRAVWGKMIRNYILKRENLLNVYLLIDSRHSPQKIDIEFMNFLGENSVPFTIVFTKIDKQTANKTNENLRNYKNELLKYWEELPQIILTSAEKRQGLEELMDSIKSIIPYYNK
ncbi:MAG: ribosome biogenesis GTP-binding protein YihA/YsxC [Bacteroidales bacterium]|jgi:GTP-binding protein|nr:YihA family ribosome biogenesis GTP-binding protein [Bacteroidales bacterium]MBQ2398384.1 YihA family ribosome biogenesis GTP-binding protein [Bacteroidales bacterium]MBQ5872541.1 YihA family ribosome biogenesis GTP-binding protein [Bacteroidales bacterium]MBQ5891902.1 YihA family ribosome biogenesis GTP-binding protein [Bacteroidales bacterium]MED9963005.1 ribosome biogenesis GTP-binding protein YihA/YsxC [Bacteroidales bacterium]